MKNVWLIGAGGMAQDYIKVLKDLDVNLTVIGRSDNSAKLCKKNTDIDVLVGGLNKFLLSSPLACSHAIVSVGVENLYQTTKQLLEYGVVNILLEKPGAMIQSEFETLNLLTKDKNANILIAYNRRFYASTLKAREIIKQDNGVMSFNFEFTEWAHMIEPLIKANGVKEKWFLVNSTHIVDMAFFLGGNPKEINSYTSGSLSWHPSASNFAGSGISYDNALFSYSANWESAGRWSVEILTKEHRLIFRPIEKLQIQKRGTIPQIFDETIDYTLDEKYKPGLFLQTQKFIECNFSDMCTIDDQTKANKIYSKIANYK